MEIKGSAVKSIKEYVQRKHPGQYNSWVNSLPEESKKIISSTIYATNWYPIRDAAEVPTSKLGELIFQSPLKGAWESGRYSAEMALSGIYKVFVKALNPAYIIQRASKILPTYYKPSEIVVVGKGDKMVKLHITDFQNMNKILENRICGWIERALEISGCQGVQINIITSITDGNDVSEIEINWN